MDWAKIYSKANKQDNIAQLHGEVKIRKGNRLSDGSISYTMQEVQDLAVHHKLYDSDPKAFNAIFTHPRVLKPTWIQIIKSMFK